MTDEEYPDYLEELDRKARNLLYLQEIRYAAGWTQDQMAILLGCSKTTYVKIEKEGASRMQYLAVRALLDDAAKTNPFLAKTIAFFLDDPSVTALQKIEYASFMNDVRRDIGHKRSMKYLQEVLSDSVKPWEVIGPFGLNTYRRLKTETVPGGVKYVLKNK